LSPVRIGTFLQQLTTMEIDVAVLSKTAECRHYELPLRRTRRWVYAVHSLSIAAALDVSGRECFLESFISSIVLVVSLKSWPGSDLALSSDFVFR